MLQRQTPESRATREVAHWRALASRIPDDTFRHDALDSLNRKRPHIYGCALFSTLPSTRSPDLLRLLVAYDILGDFLDIASERGAHEGLRNGMQLHRRDGRGTRSFPADLGSQAGVAQEISICGPSVPSADIQVAGLLPSAASNIRMELNSGPSVPVTVENGTYAARFARTGALPVSISWSLGGTIETSPVNIPARASSEDCEP